MEPADLATRAPWFARQPASLRDALLEAGRVVRLGAGEWAYGEGDAATGIIAVLDGIMRIEASANGDRTVLVGLAPPGTVLGQSARRGGGPRIVTARAGPPSRVMLVSDVALERIAEAQPALWRAVSELVYAQLDGAVHVAAMLLGLSPAARIAARLIDLASDGVLHASQSDLGELTGLSRKAVNAHLNAMARAGLIAVGYAEVRVSDPAGLARLRDSG